MYFAKRSKDPSQQVQPKGHLRTSSKQPRPSDFFLKSDAQADETKRTTDTLVAGIDTSAINDELEDDSHGTAVQFYNSMTSARRKPNSSVLKEDAENLILFLRHEEF